MSRVTIEAPAKVNLRLEVLEPDDSGYHDLVTLFCALELTDTVEVEVEDLSPGGEGADAGGRVSLEVTGAELGPAHENLAVRAAVAFLESARVDRGVAIRLTKRIPAGGGLGGGSSDAAATLIALDRLLPGRAAPETLGRIAAALGSDVPFFLGRAPLALGEGRGDRIKPLPPLPPRPALLVFPPFQVSTAEAYGWLDAARSEGGASSRPIPVGTGGALRASAAVAGGDDVARWEDVAGRDDVAGWQHVVARAVNDFEPVVLARHPLLREIRDVLLDTGAAPAMLSGTGSTVFGIFASDAERAAARARLQRVQPALTLVETRTAR